ncbi:hypothetical protein QF001_001564 [Paraburkholderia youngii]
MSFPKSRPDHANADSSKQNTHRQGRGSLEPLVTIRVLLVRAHLAVMEGRKANERHPQSDPENAKGRRRQPV